MRRTREVAFFVAKVSCHDVGENEPIPIINGLAANVTFESSVYDLKPWSLKFVCCHNVTFVMALLVALIATQWFFLKDE